MKKIFAFVLLFLSAVSFVNAQSFGDTILVNTFNYTQTTSPNGRDTVINFPNLSGDSIEKIYMLYNMRCKNGLVSPGSPANQRSIGCGEWDYSCNTYLTDSTKTDSVKASAPSHIIKGFSGSTYPYTFSPTFTYYQFTQQSVIHNSTISELDTMIGTGNHTMSAPLQSSKVMAKSQFLWTAAELNAAGLTAGNITSLKLNISSIGTATSFLKIKMKHTTKTILDAANPDLTGFTEVYFLNTTFVNGLNEFNFYNNFNWNDTDNIIIEFSFENPIAGADNIVLADSMIGNMGIISEGNDYCLEFTGSNFVQIGSSTFSNFSNQLTISFWSNGNANVLPTNTSVVYATDANNNRQVNVHFPWSDSNIYWDCGTGGPYDRINKAATPAQFEGNWNHWAFTKNSTTGSMKIYLNGVLWHSGTGKTLPIQLTEFEIADQHGLQNPYFGKIDEFALWNTELSAADIQSTMHKAITPSHPAYSNLMAYYSFNEGVGDSSINVTPAADTAMFTGNPVWRKSKAVDMFKGFMETTFRPTVTFVQGVYTQATTPIIIIDSTVNNPNTVYGYAVGNHAIIPIDTTVSYTAGYVYKYDGETGAKIDSIFVPIVGTINITTLNYYKIYPSRFQIMSFVTPYGVNLNLGINGKTWTYDVTDFAPLLKGKRRMTMDAGGQRQEDMDIKFMFIKGTPPHVVKDISNIWKVDNVGWQNIQNDNYFESRNVTMLSNASSFKIRTAITGHGQEGEFIAQQHYLDFNGGTKEFQWNVWKPCASNVIYPQGGTWIYDRAGWCPGASTDLQEDNIDSFATTGSTVNIDYGISSAVSGASNYWVSSQLVSYGAATHTLDANLVDIKTPTQKNEYSRINTICTSPSITIQNTGSTPLTAVQIEYWVNNNPIKENFIWTGNLSFLDKVDVALPSAGSLWSSLNGGAATNDFHVQLKNPNGGTDGYANNNSGVSKFVIPPVLPGNFYVYFRSNSAASESEYELRDASGAIIFSRNNMNNNTNYNDTFHLTQGCYSFIINDSDDDGFDFWNNSDGTGICRLKNMSSGIIKSFAGDFGHSIIYNFTVDFPLAYTQINQPENTISIYPNPTENDFTVSSSIYLINQIQIYNTLGQEIKMPINYGNHAAHINSSGFAKGMYILKIKNDEGKEEIKRVVVE